MSGPAHSTQELETPISSTDMKFMLLIIRGYASSYSIWTYMKNNPKEYPKPIAYKNINQRLLRLARIGLLEGEVKFDTPTSTHGRRDYKVTRNGLDQLIPYMKKHTEVVQDIIKYMDKIGADKNLFGLILLEEHTHMTKLLNVFEDQTGILFNDSHWSKIASGSKHAGLISQTVENFNAEMGILEEHITDSSDAQRKEDEIWDKYAETVEKERKFKSVTELLKEKGITSKTTSDRKKKPV